jgi:peptidoglycan/LPS O-acetylase OafA/YrhL
MPTRELQSLTPLRGLAATWVICFHYVVAYFPAFHPERYSWILNKGFLAVDMFFMLSGFVLSHVYWRAFADDSTNQGRNYWSFMGARVARLYPLHLFNLCQFLIAALAFHFYQYGAAGELDAIPLHGARSLTALVANVAMLQGLKASQLAWNYPAWSISVEFLAYFLFPLALPLLAQAGARTRWLAACGALAAMGLFAYLSGGDFNQWDGPITLLRCLPEFIIGAMLYTGFRNSHWPDWLGRDYAAVAIFASVLLLIHFGVSDIFIAVAFPALILSAVMNAGRVASILNAAPLVWLGEISYSLYLAHGFVQFLTTRLLSSAGVENTSHLSRASSMLVLLAMLGATLLIATLTHREVEIVGRSRLRMLLGARPAGLANRQWSR